MLVRERGTGCIKSLLSSPTADAWTLSPLPTTSRRTGLLTLSNRTPPFLQLVHGWIFLKTRGHFVERVYDKPFSAQLTYLYSKTHRKFISNIKYRQTTVSTTSRYCRLQFNPLTNIVGGQKCSSLAKCWYVDAALVALSRYYHHLQQMCERFRH